jgi:hypothetical protein
MIEGKFEIEINFVGDGRIFVNYWDYMHGEDVVAEFLAGELVCNNEIITFSQYMDKLKETLSKYKDW